MSESPSWLNTAAPAPSASAPAPSIDPLSIESSTAENAAAAGTNGTADSDEKDLPSIILMMRLVNMGAAAALITISIFNILALPAISGTVLSIYAICGGLLICCLETQLKFLRVLIAVNFGFLFNSVWRFLFYMILGSVCYSFKNPFGFIMACVMVGIAFFNTFILCRYPAYRKVREQIAEKEDKRIEDRISKEVRTQAVKQATKNITKK
mmetsp:Transcript_24343/g.57310  ORF Transcript_24343/g.57310 Transcript_24343/m.57310 type:complete len:210 (+) Transcript_24343:119-748(+)|eukprot:CAMPEP_0197173434 /NCGR_PEP_ID=MMETSP1423-20130617/372_1 /TAXON_ID=476441 /ORGANISM="Pseudo-nitzschia heimii, Strain UNC1101" /LENGTH=209 /DNA_ID=CAMNT_0042622253 /DNA_START=118 /DNA_END=747 /DNA_ORIENTATION=+